VWWWGFVLVNGALAGVLFVALREKEVLSDLNRWFAAFLAGASYSALVRLKFTTLPNNTPVGIDTFYEALRGVVHRRINRIVQVWRGRESKKLAEGGLEELRQQALILVGTNALLSEEQRNADKAWINQTACGQKDSRSGSEVVACHFHHHRAEGVSPRPQPAGRV
jgi:hypothetical protein